MTISLKTKLTALAVASAGLPIVVVGWSVIDLNKEALESTNRELLSVVVNDVASDVQVAIDEAGAVLNQVSGMLADSNLNSDVRVGVGKAIVGSQHWINAVGVYDAKGLLVEEFVRENQSPNSTRGAKKQTLPEKLESEITEKAKADGGAFSQVNQGLLVQPVSGAAATWFTAGYFPSLQIQEKVESISAARLGIGAAVYILDQERGIVAHNNPEMLDVNRLSAGDDFLFSANSKMPASKFAVFGEYERDGETMIGAARSLDRLPWTIVAEVPAKEVYASINRSRRLILFATLGAVLLSALLAFLIARYLFKPISRLLRFAQLLAQRNFSQQVKVTSNDELGVLGNAFNAAATELQIGEDKLRNEIAVRRDLSRYLPVDLVGKILRQEEELRLGTTSRDISVLFADAASFNTLAQSEGAERVAKLLNELFTVLTEIVFRHGGTIDKFIGDSVMAVWGGLSASEGHAERAVEAARDMVIWMDTVNEVWAEQFGVRLLLSIGVSSGDALVGNFGSESRMEYSALGDTVGVAAHLEELAGPGQVFVSDKTAERLPDAYQLISLGPRYIMGRHNEVEVFELTV